MLPLESKKVTQVIELSKESLDAFCDDISTMFEVDMSFEEKEATVATLKDIKKHFKKVTAVHTVQAEGALDGRFQLIFDQSGLFTLAGVIVMLPSKRITEGAKRGTLDDAKGMSDAVGEVGNLLVGTWDRVFRDELDGHKHFRKGDTFIGDPFKDPSKVTGLNDSDEFHFFLYEVSLESYPSFKCAALLPIDKTKVSATEPVALDMETATVEEPEASEPAVEESAKTVPTEAKGEPVTEEKVKEPEPKAEVEKEDRKETEAETDTDAGSPEPPVGEDEKLGQEPVPASEPPLVEEPTPEPVEEPAPIETPASGPAGEATAATVEEPALEPAPAVVEEPALEPAEQTAPTAVEEPLPEPAEEPAQAAVEEPTSEPVEEAPPAADEEPASEPVEEPAPVAVEESASEPAEEAAPAATEELAPEPSKEPVPTVAEESVSVATEETTPEPPVAAKEDVSPVKAKEEIPTEPRATEPSAEQSHSSTGTPSEEGDDASKAAVPEVASISIPPVSVPPTPAASETTFMSLTAQEIMTPEVAWVGPHDSVNDVLSTMQQKDTGYALVGQEGVLQGLVSKSNILGALSPYLRPVFSKWRRPADEATLDIKIQWIMSRPVRTVQPEASLAVVIEQMRQFGGRCLPVVAGDGSVQGLITVFDILRVMTPELDTQLLGHTPQAPCLMV